MTNVLPYILLDEIFHFTDYFIRIDSIMSNLTYNLSVIQIHCRVYFENTRGLNPRQAILSQKPIMEIAFLKNNFISLVDIEHNSPRYKKSIMLSDLFSTPKRFIICSSWKRFFTTRLHFMLMDLRVVINLTDGNSCR